jgi:hypothetical protein
MTREIDLTQGGYEGDSIEEGFKWFTSQHMEYWWQFREVLRAEQDKNKAHWKRNDGTPISDDEHRTLIAVSFLNYAVYTGAVEAFSFFTELRAGIAERNGFIIRRDWKALYSSLYSGFNALCNLLCVVVLNDSPFGKDPNRPWNKTPKQARELLKTSEPGIAQLIQQCQARLEIRDHLDHFWTIWTGMSDGKFLYDRNFRKGYIVIDPAKEVTDDIDAVQRAIDDIVGCVQHFNVAYKAMAVTGGFLDRYLSKNGWCIDYSDFGYPHNGKRPLP